MRLMLLCCSWKDERMGEDEAGGRLPLCAGCRQHIYDEQYLQALSTDWHTICFRYGDRKGASACMQMKAMQLTSAAFSTGNRKEMKSVIAVSMVLSLAQR
ncbi:LIM domain kinase 1a isoform X1 [Tachysurus ichikawai]